MQQTQRRHSGATWWLTCYIENYMTLFRKLIVSSHTRAKGAMRIGGMLVFILINVGVEQVLPWHLEWLHESLGCQPHNYVTDGPALVICFSGGGLAPCEVGPTLRLAPPPPPLSPFPPLFAGRMARFSSLPPPQLFLIPPQSPHGSLGLHRRQLPRLVGFWWPPPPPYLATLNRLSYLLVEHECAIGLATSSVRPKKSKSIDMCLDWIKIPGLINPRRLLH